MAFLMLVEFMFVFTLLILGVSQVIIPLWNNKPLFPAFRTPGKIEHELGEAEEELHSLEVERDVLMRRRAAEDLKRSLHQQDGADAGSSDKKGDA